MAALLQLDRVTIRFGGLTAVSELNLAIGAGELVGLIGPNGAGKTTAFNLITGVYQPTDGVITFNGQPTAQLKAHQLARLGIARTFQNIRLFTSMSVFDNVRTAFATHCGAGAAFARVKPRWSGRFWSCSRFLDWGSSAITRPNACHMAINGGWKSSGRWPRGRSYCCWTNPPPA
jgi:ABC-type branched-subunit amino acid transport system ATPase component